MKRKIYLFCTMMLVAAAAAGCGSSKQETASTEQATAEETTAAETEAVTTEAETETEAAEASVDPLYEQFLNGEATVKFDILELNYMEDSYPDIVGCFNKDQEYTFYDVLNAYASQMADVFECDQTLDAISIGYIDCGEDGESELAIEAAFVNTGAYDGTSLWVVKNIDGQLQMIFYDLESGRSAGEMFTNGVYHVTGSDSAAEDTETYYVIDADHNLHFIYGVNTYFAASALAVADVDAASAFSAQGIGDEDVIIYQYYFAPAEAYETTENFYHGSMWTYTDAEGSSDSAIYEESSSYRQAWNSVGLNLSEKSLLESIVTDTLDSLGLTEDMLSGTPIEWTSLDVFVSAIND